MSKLVEMALDLVLKEIPPEVRAMLSQENVERMGVKLGELYQKLDKHINDMEDHTNYTQFTLNKILAEIAELKKYDNGSSDRSKLTERQRRTRDTTSVVGTD